MPRPIVAEPVVAPVAERDYLLDVLPGDAGFTIIDAAQPVPEEMHWGFVGDPIEIPREEPLVQQTPELVDTLAQLVEARVRLAEIRRTPPRRGGARVRRDGDADIPGDVVEEPTRFIHREPTVIRKAPAKKKPKEYPENGVFWNGTRFARTLTMMEQNCFMDYGYRECIRSHPDLEYIEKEKPIDDKEECIILMSELADHYATEECNKTVEGFNLKDHNKEYQIAYKKHLKVILGFKRNKNG